MTVAMHLARCVNPSCSEARSLECARHSVRLNAPCTGYEPTQRAPHYWRSWVGHAPRLSVLPHRDYEVMGGPRATGAARRRVDEAQHHRSLGEHEAVEDGEGDQRVLERHIPREALGAGLGASAGLLPAGAARALALPRQPPELACRRGPTTESAVSSVFKFPSGCISASDTPGEGGGCVSSGKRSGDHLENGVTAESLWLWSCAAPPVAHAKQGPNVLFCICCPILHLSNVLFCICCPRPKWLAGAPPSHITVHFRGPKVDARVAAPSPRTTSRTDKVKTL
jgi:hypothetical protein